MRTLLFSRRQRYLWCLPKTSKIIERFCEAASATCASRCASRGSQGSKEEGENYETIRKWVLVLPLFPDKEQTRQKSCCVLSVEIHHLRLNGFAHRGRDISRFFCRQDTRETGVRDCKTIIHRDRGKSKKKNEPLIPLRQMGFLYP